MAPLEHVANVKFHAVPGTNKHAAASLIVIHHTFLIHDVKH